MWFLVLCGRAPPMPFLSSHKNKLRHQEGRNRNRGCYCTAGPWRLWGGSAPFPFPEGIPRGEGQQCLWLFTAAASFPSPSLLERPPEPPSTQPPRAKQGSALWRLAITVLPTDPEPCLSFFQQHSASPRSSGHYSDCSGSPVCGVNIISSISYHRSRVHMGPAAFSRSHLVLAATL